MSCEKAVARSVSMLESLWDAADARAESTTGDRSSYIKRLVQADLASAGCLPGSPEAEVKALVDQLVKSHGAAPVRAAIAPLFDAAVAQEERV